MELTTKQKEQLQKHRRSWESKVVNQEFLNNTNFEDIVSGVNWLYQYCDLAKPNDVLLANSPLEALYMANLYEEKVPAEEIRSMSPEEMKLRVPNPKFYDFSSYTNYSDIGWVSVYEWYLENTDFKADDNTRDAFNNFKELIKHVFMSLQFDVLFVAVKYPNQFHINEEEVLHNANGPAVEWKDGYKQHYMFGRFLEAEIFEGCSTIEGARKQYNGTENADIQGLIVSIVKERWGNDGLAEMLEAEVVDEGVIAHENGYTEIQKLYKSKEAYEWAVDSKGNTNVKLAWQHMTCPSTGTTYLVETCPTFNSVVESAKFLRPAVVPENISYKWQSAN